MSRLLRLTALAIAVTGCASAYYHFTRFTSRLAPLRPVVEKFDLNALPSHTLSWFVGDLASVRLGPGDSLMALVSQVRSAAKVWNDVESSDLRLAFGGFTAGVTSPGASPSLDVLFAEVPPGLVAMGGPTVRAEFNGEFVPIVKSVVLVQPDLTARPSYTEALFTTLVHEFGHALGLQHTFTSGVMSTSITRAVGKSKILTSDDIAGLSLLYPRPGYTVTAGTIAGRVTLLNGAPVQLASVVAIAANGAAISTLTQPDGTYRIEGLPAPRTYYVYVHPLPPPREGQTTPGDIVAPLDPDGRPLSAGLPFDTVFYTFTPGSSSGTRDPVFATQVPATPGAPTENINFSVRQKAEYGIHSVETISFQGAQVLRPAYLNGSMPAPRVFATGPGLIAPAGGPVAGLTATMLGGASLAVSRHPSDPRWIQLSVNPQALLISSDSARHVVFAANNDIYVRPSAFYHVERPAPQILGVSSAIEGTTRVAMVIGTNLTVDTRVLFDGVAGQTRAIDEAVGIARLTVIPPAGLPGYRAVVVALNADGQSSLPFQTEQSSYTYPVDAALSPLTGTVAAPNILQAGTESVIRVDGSFPDSQISVGFGSSDVVVRRVFVQSPTRLLLNVWVAANAQPAAVNLTIAAGLQIFSQSFAVSVQPAQPRPFWLTSNYLNTATGQALAFAGSQITLQVGATPVALNTGAVSVVLNDTVRLPLIGATANTVTFQVPSDMPLGPMQVRLDTGTERSLPIAIPVEPAPPRIVSATSGAIGTSDVVTLSVANVDRDSDLSVQIAGKSSRVVQVTPDGGNQRILVEVPADTPRGADLPVTVVSGTRISEPISLKIGG